MKMENINKWKSAATDGLILSAITIVYLLVTNLLPAGAKWSSFVTIPLWIAKFGGCIWLLYWLMRLYSMKFETVTYKSSFAYGTLVSLFSAIVCSCWQYFSMTVLFSKSTDSMMAQVISAMSSQYTEEQMEAIMPVLDNLPQISLFANLVYFTLFGLIVSAITANYTKKVNPFNDLTR